MSFFRNDRGDIRPVRATAAGVTGVAALGTLLSSFYINEERQVSLEVLFGRVNHVEKAPGWKWKNPLATRYPYSLARQKTTVDQATNLRLGDDLRVSGKFDVEYEVDETANVPKLYFDLKDQGGDLEGVVQVRSKDAAVRTLESLTIKDLIPDTEKEGEESSFTNKITMGIQQRLQKDLTEQGWPVRVLGVFSDGFHFTPDSEKRIEEIVRVRADRVKLDLRQENAIKAQEVFRDEAKADRAYIDALRDGGLPDDDVAKALCLKMARDAGRVNEPFAAGCMGGAIPPVGVITPPAEGQVQPQPVQGLEEGR